MPPYNPLSPYRTDVLVVYDASAPGAMDYTVDPLTGKRIYTIANPGLLTEIAAYTGSTSNVMNLTTGMRVNSNEKGGFTSEWMRNRPVICMILYTDAAGSGSGFRLKSGPRRQQTWQNWHVCDANGQFWIHKEPALSQSGVAGAADDTVKNLSYQYLDRSVTIDLDQGIVTFESDPGGEVTVDYSYYTGDTFSQTNLLTSHGDFVEYQPSNTYVGQAGEYTLTNETRNEVYEDNANDYGRITTRVSWQKDMGVLTFPTPEEMPVGRRIFADYYYHSYKRLTNDGHGDLSFNDPIIVPDVTEAFPDYTYSDIMIVNEGDATLENGLIKFIARGYDTDTADGVVLTYGPSSPKPVTYATYGDIKDQVLDLNRPWDIQKGTSDETYERMGCAVYSTFIWPRSLPKTNTGGLADDMFAISILSNWGGGTKTMASPVLVLITMG